MIGNLRNLLHIRSLLVIDHRIYLVGFQRALNICHHVLPENRGLLSVVVGHSDKNGVIQLVQIAAPNHGTDNGIHSDVQIHPVQVHICQHFGSVVV